MNQFDYAARRAALERQQKLAAMLAEQSQQPMGPLGQMIGQIFVPTYAGAIRNIGSSLAGGVADWRAKDAEQVYLKDATMARADEMSGFNQQYKADPQAAVIGALASQLPELQRVGTALSRSAFPIPRQSAAPGSSIKGYTPGTWGVREDPSSPEGFKKLFEVPFGPRTVSPDQRVMTFGGAMPEGAPPSTSSAPSVPGGRITDTRDPNWAPAQAESKAVQEGSFTKIIEPQYQAAKKTARILPNINAAESALRQGIITGKSAPIELTLSQIGAAFGLPIDEAKVANTESFRREMRNSLGAVLPQFGTGNSITENDVKMALDIIGDINSTPASLLRAVQALKAGMANEIMQHNAMIAEKGADSTLTPSARNAYSQLLIPGVDYSQIEKETENTKFNPETGLVEIKSAPATKSGTPGIAKPPAQSKPQIRNDADYNALPSGTEYLDPNGNLRRKR